MANLLYGKQLAVALGKAACCLHFSICMTYVYIHHTSYCNIYI